MNKVIVKKVLSILMALLIITTLSMEKPIAVGAQTPTSLTVTSVKGVKGGNANISVNISANSGVAAGTFVLKYDSAKFEVTSADKGSAISMGTSDVYVDSKNGKVTLAYINIDGFKDSGEILDVKFKAKNATYGVYPITLSVTEFFDKNYKAISNRVVNGKITVIPATPKVSVLRGNSTAVKGSATKGSVVYAKIGSKTYYATASFKSGAFSIKIPKIKKGVSVLVSCKAGGQFSASKMVKALV